MPRGFLSLAQARNADKLIFMDTPARVIAEALNAEGKLNRVGKPFTAEAIRKQRQRGTLVTQPQHTVSFTRVELMLALILFCEALEIAFHWARN